jgi:peroxiredoxin
LGEIVLFVALRLKWRHREAEAPSPAGGLLGMALLAAGVGLLSWAAWRHLHRPTPPDAAPEPDVADAARGFLRERNVKPLSGPLAELLADTGAQREPTQEHPLLGRPAPDFELPDHREQVWRLRDRLGRGPLVLVFYYGYHCNHCVGQLFALHDDVGKFRELGAEVVAVSADPPEWTRERFRQYGAFAFPVLSDPGNKVAQAYGVYRPASGKAREDLQHATFVIGRDGRIAWAYRGNQPFTGNRTLLYELARLERRLSDGKRE